MARSKRGGRFDTPDAAARFDAAFDALPESLKDFWQSFLVARLPVNSACLHTNAVETTEADVLHCPDCCIYLF